jgi:flavin reductase (DIM6/NTAB) family NADH-FMN oxidoreductase RutF
MITDIFTREELNEALQGEVIVTFTKADGTERVMRCTQNPDLMDTPPTVSEVVRPPSDNVRVYDLEASGWRSFNLPTVKSVEVL